jgi:indole-3-glycerol phosphate synthase
MAAGLRDIVASTRTRLARTKVDLRELERRATEHTPRGFAAALRRVGTRGAAVIAELKKASPSRGVIRPDFPVAELAARLASSGAAALSVLTDEEFFQGSLRNLAEASRATFVPCLRKDFIVAESQVVEARAWRADAILLIVAALSDAELRQLFRRARELELDVLCEVHDETELARALDAGCDIIGVNSRDLHTFQVDLQTAVRLAERLPKSALRVAESGIHTAQDIRLLRERGYQGFLIGEWLMAAGDPGSTLERLLIESAVLPGEGIASPITSSGA